LTQESLEVIGTERDTPIFREGEPSPGNGMNNGKKHLKKKKGGNRPVSKRKEESHALWTSIGAAEGEVSQHDEGDNLLGEKLGVLERRSLWYKMPRGISETGGRE